MAILGMFGFPGSGKTTVLSAIADRENRGLPSWFGLQNHDSVFTSFPCRGAYQLDYSKLGDFKVSNALILIDEISLHADNRAFKSFGSEKVEFFKLLRHLHSDCIWCSQSATDADKKIRTSTDYMYLIEPFFFDYSVIKPIRKDFDITNDITDKYFLSRPLDWIFINRKKYYHMFDSYDYKDVPEMPRVFWEMPLQETKKQRFRLFSRG